MTYEAREFHPAFEEYCVAIYELSEDGVEVIQARIADRLEVSRPAVSEMMRKLEAAEMVVTGEDGIVLTTDGMRLANRIVRRHRLAERLLTDVLGLSWTDAHYEAGKWEHVISAPVEAALVRVLNDPTTCPHGNPIPGSDYEEPANATVLSALGVGSRFRVERIPEELEFRDGLLAFLESADVMPGNTGIITAMAPDGTTTVEISDSRVGVGAFAADRIVVTAAPAASA